MLDWLLNTALGFVDTVISFLLSLFPNDYLASSVNSYITDFFDFILSVFLTFSNWYDINFFFRFFWITFQIELYYIIFRFMVWVVVKVIKP